MQAKALDRRTLLQAALILGAAFWFLGLPKNAPVPKIPVAEVSVLEAVGAIAMGAIVIDVRERGSYAEGHIAGAISVPIDELKQRAGEFASAKEKQYIVYCGDGSTLGPEAARALTAAGHTATRNLPAGFSGWKAAGQAVATGKS